MNVLVYKQTHIGDPDEDGRFGVRACMGRVRGFDYKAVVGIGGIGHEPTSNGIADRITWVGIGPHKAEVSLDGHPVVTFDHFFRPGLDGPELEGMAPMLAERMLVRNTRYILRNLSAAEQIEVGRILELAESAPASTALRRRTSDRECVPRRRRRRC